jgi:Zn-dependent peptidase ImmA (M78 family)/DNA-binding XRE family transcriptional regulator
MKETVNPNMVILARESRGLTQSELAEKLDVTQAIVSRIEAGLFDVSDELLNGISDTLEYPKRFFFEPANIYPLGVHFYRKAKGIAQKALAMIKAEINIDSIRIQKLLRSVEITNANVPYFDLDDGRYKTASGVARAVRHAWAVPEGPIQNLTGLIENAGIIVIHAEFDTRFFDADSFATSNGQYVVILNASKPGDRVRFSLAHELGHVLMHRIPNDLVEDQSNEFASEFLMPEEDIKQDLSKLTLERLANLKRHWKVSMQALLMRARSLERISESQYKYLWMQMGKMGYRLNEPITIPLEPPSLLQETINVHIEKLGYSNNELKAMLYVNDKDFKKYPIERRPHLRVVSKVLKLQGNAK